MPVPKQYISECLSQSNTPKQYQSNTLEEAGKGIEDLISASEAAEHFKQSMLNLANNQIDLRGKWTSSNFGYPEFGAEADNFGEEFLEITDDFLFVYGDEINSNGDRKFTVPMPMTESILDEEADRLSAEFANSDSPWPRDEIVEFLEGIIEAEAGRPGLDIVERDERDVIRVDLAVFGFVDRNCGAFCSLAELRTTIDDWDEQCLHNDYDFESNSVPGGQNSNGFCEESDDHNGQVIGYSEVTWTDRLGGDRLLRLKRDFFTDSGFIEGATKETTEYGERGLFFGVIERNEALEHTIDLTGTWEIHIFSDNLSLDSTGAPVTAVFTGVDGGDGAEMLPVDFCADYTSCTWKELNDAYEDGNTRLTYVRGTDVINWLEDSSTTNDDFDQTFTMKRVSN